MSTKQLTPEQLFELTEKEFHKSNKLWSEASVAYANAGLKLFDDMIKFVYQALTSMGLVAGFGFAGIQGVKNLYLFGAGELIMFLAMIYGMYKIKVIYKQNSDSVEDKAIEIRKVFEKKANVLSEMMKEILEKGAVKSTSLIERYEDSNKEILSTFGADKTPVKQNDESRFINYMIIVFIVGFMILVTSYLPFWSTNKNVELPRRGNHFLMKNYR
ncbi:hypothetical protein C4564_05910 [Candidatus Microgenomates bacterium]|nr:MAG: hypothetical protein C4564_05910 [Candidatus Microgenomates bacterium]